MACKLLNGSTLNTQGDDNAGYETPGTATSPPDETNTPNDVYENVIDDYETPTTIISQHEARSPYVAVNVPSHQGNKKV